jgi:dynein heavy chain
MRAVKSVLVMAGALKRANPQLPEDVVLIRWRRRHLHSRHLLDGPTIMDPVYGCLCCLVQCRLCIHSDHLLSASRPPCTTRTA